MTMNIPGYEALADVLKRAYDQAATGKGKERHAGAGVPFERQPMSTINIEQGSIDGFLYQARKKALESKRLPAGRAQAELLGAINYLAGAVIALDTWAEDTLPDDRPMHVGVDLAGSPDSADAFAYMFEGVQDALQKAFIIPPEWIQKARQPGHLWMRHREWLDKPIAQEMQMRMEAAEAAMLQQAQQQAESLTGAPWYPPGTTGWVEVSRLDKDRPERLRKGDVIEVITREERTAKRMHGFEPASAYLYDWTRPANDAGRIFAYRIIKGQSK